MSEATDGVEGLGRLHEAELTRDAEIEVDRGRERTGGEVYLVGAGPGDPELLTLKAARLMEECDVVLHDRLVPDAILDRVRRDADFISVGKGPDRHTMTQEKINALLIEWARSGKQVLRLKGGDPLVFGRGGEEAEALATAGVRYRIVPGITAATGCAAAASIPLTHREYATSCILATGHSCREDRGPDWSALARGNRTAVFYMGLGNVERLRECLLAYGRAPQTPAAVVIAGTTPEQEVLHGHLDELPEVVTHRRAASPALVLVGEAVAASTPSTPGSMLGFVKA